MSVQLTAHHYYWFYYYLPECCNVSEDIQQSFWQPLLMTSRKYIQWYIACLMARFAGHTQHRITVGRTPLDEWSARLSDLYITTHNTHNRQTSMPPVGFEPTTPVAERPQTYALDHSATGIGWLFIMLTNVTEILCHISWHVKRHLQDIMCKTSVTAQVTKITDAVKRKVNSAVVFISDSMFRKFRRVPSRRLQ